MKIMLSALILSSALLFVACGGSGEKEKNFNRNQSVEEVVKAQMAMNDKAAIADEKLKSAIVKSVGSSARLQNNSAEQEKGTQLPPDESVDIDISSMPSSLAYSMVFNMAEKPDEHIGKTVRIKGAFATTVDTTGEKRYYACMVTDATACCTQGIEFEVADKLVFPEDYPSPGEEITVVGKYDVYSEGNYRYSTLRDARIL